MEANSLSHEEDAVIKEDPLRTSFNGSVEIEGRGEGLTKVVGGLALRRPPADLDGGPSPRFAIPT